MIAQVITEFGTKLGLPQLAFNNEHVIHLSVEDMGELYLEETGNFVLIYLARTYENIDKPFLRKALQLCHYKQKNDMPIAVGMVNEDTCSFLIRLAHDQVTEPTIQESIRSLAKLHDKMDRSSFN